ncbi:hypothetical protein [Alteromonas gracilis]|uniref:hypothetical protein n=1 Tax=Alteromonas gracilis TaxID=1479524 RepID=UPI0037369EAE
MKSFAFSSEAVLRNGSHIDEWTNKLVIFRRDRLSSELIEEYGTMAVDTVYKVEGAKPGSNNQQLTICSPFFPLSFSVAVEDIEIATSEELDYDSMIKPFEHFLGLDGSLLVPEANQ